MAELTIPVVQVPPVSVRVLPLPLPLPVDVSGDVRVPGDLSGDVRVPGDLPRDVRVPGDLPGDVRVPGEVLLPGPVDSNSVSVVSSSEVALPGDLVPGDLDRPVPGDLDLDVVDRDGGAYATSIVQIATTASTVIIRGRFILIP